MTWRCAIKCWKCWKGIRIQNFSYWKRSWKGINLSRHYPWDSPYKISIKAMESKENNKTWRPFQKFRKSHHFSWQVNLTIVWFSRGLRRWCQKWNWKILNWLIDSLRKFGENSRKNFILLISRWKIDVLNQTTRVNITSWRS